MPNSHESDPSEPGPGGEDEHGAVVARVEEELGQQLADLDLRYKRALADLDNYRKRSQQEIQRRVAETREALLRDWLEVSDSVERALSVEPGGDRVAEGLQAVRGQIDAILARQGVRRVGAVGELFDPRSHEAVAVRETEDAPSGTIVEVVRPGFSLDGRVLRPALVVVSRAPPGEG
jgi:molecular chaperone GrpE